MRPTKGEISCTPASAHALALHAGGFVQGDQFAALGDGGFGVERQRRVDLGRDAARHVFQDLGAEGDQQVVDDVLDRGAVRLRHGLFQQRTVFRLLHRLQDQRRVGGGVLRRVGLDRLEVAGVGYHGGELLELFELVHGASMSEKRFRDCNAASLFNCKRLGATEHRSGKS
jgi:hypothetical protein